MDDDRLLDVKKLCYGYFNVVCHDIYTLRILLEILQTISYGSKSCIFFTPDGIKLVGSCQNRKSLMITSLWADGFLDFRIEGNYPVDEEGNPIKVVELYVNVGDIVSCIKSVKKGDLRTIRLGYDQTGKATSLEISSEGESSTLDSVIPLSIFDNERFYDMFETHYKHSRPTVNITIGMFASLLSGLKDRVCTLVEFQHVKGCGILVKGYTNGVVVSVTHFYSGGIDEDSETKENRLSKIVNKRFKVLDKHKIKMEDFKAKSQWISKIGRSCCKASIINMWLEPGKPFIIRTTNGAMGHTYYCFTSSTRVRPTNIKSVDIVSSKVEDIE